MNYNSNQDNYLLNQNTQQRYLNIQSFETQSEQTLKIIDFSYSNEFQDLSGRFDFIKKMYIFLTVEFFINYVFLMLGIYTDMINWLYHLFLVCKFENGIEMCEIEFWPTWLFYFSLSISIVLQFILYFGVVFLRQDPNTKWLLILQLIFFGFTFAAVFIFVVFSVGPLYVMISIGITFLIIISQMIYLNLNQQNTKDLPYKNCSIIIICVTIILVIILSFLKSFSIFSSISCSAFGVFYSFYLMIETELIMCKGTFQLQPSDSLYGSFVLNSLMMQPLVRICDIVYRALRKIIK